MNSSNTTNNVILAVIIILSIALVGLQVTKPSINNAHHNAFQKNILEMQGSSNALQESILKTRYGVNSHYDFVQFNMLELYRHEKGIKHPPGFLSTKTADQIKTLDNAIFDKVESINLHVNEFMRLNSLRLNSVNYLPLLIRDTQLKSPDLRNKQLLSYILTNTLQYANKPNDKQLNAIRTSLNSFLATAYFLTQPEIVSFKAHINIILDYTLSSNKIITKVGDIKINDDLNTLIDVYSNEYEATNNTISMYVQILSAMTLITIVIVLVFLIKLKAQGKIVEKTNLELNQKMQESARQTAEAEKQVIAMQEAEKEIAAHQKQADKHTAELNTAISEVNAIMNSISKGEFEHRLEESHFTGDLADLRNSVHTALDKLQASMNEIGLVSSKLAEGDLSSKITGNYEGDLGKVKTAINGSIENLARLIAKVSMASNSIQGQLEQVRSDSENVSQSSSRQSETLISTMNAVDDTSEKIKSNTQNTQQATQITSEQVTVLNEGMAVMTNMVSAMDDIKSSSESIVDIINLIDSIAFQTNLLALNAAVEAARAGEQGRGFAVVAGEVRNLAGKSADAAKDISSLIEDSNKKVQTGVDLVTNVNQSLDNIKQKVEMLQDAVHSINEASIEQSHGAKNITQAVSEAENISKQNTQMIHNTTVQINQMVELSHELDQVVRSFKL